MDAAATSAQRAAALTARLLAFSRRQSLDSRALDINRLVTSLDELLRRTMSERIEVGIAPGDNLPAGIVDANQLVTIKHGPIPAVGWPAMTMTFQATPPTLLKGVNIGQIVDFGVRTSGMDAQVTSIRPR